MPPGTRLYVANGGADSVSVIHTGTNALLATIPVAAGPQALAPDSAAGEIDANDRPDAHERSSRIVEPIGGYAVVELAAYCGDIG